MNQKAKLVVLSGLNLVMAAALSAGTHAQAAPGNQDNHKSARSNDVLQAGTHEFEASFLSVSHVCKVSHSAFDAVAVGLENIPAGVIAIHAEVERA